MINRIFSFEYPIYFIGILKAFNIETVTFGSAYSVSIVQSHRREI